MRARDADVVPGEDRPDASEAELRELLGDAAALAAGPLGGRKPGTLRSDFDGTADYALLTTEGKDLTVELRRVEYPLEELRRAIEELPLELS